MTDAQVQHVLNMLSGIQSCLTWIFWAIVWNLFFGGTSTSGIKEELKKIREKLR